MRRVLNLNGVAGKFLAAVALLLAVVPALLWLISRLLLAARLAAGIIPGMIRLSLIFGGLLLAAFVILIVLELVQDAHLHRVYLRGLGKRIRLPNGTAECPYCGNRQVQESEKRCSVCGKELA